MNPLLIMEQHLRPWIAELIASGRRVIAPQSDREFVTYQDTTSADDINLSGRKPDFSLKEFLFPGTESVLRYRLTNGKLVVEDPGSNGEPNAAEDDRREIVVVGASPCDAASLSVLDNVFLSDPPDPFYSSRRSRLTVIGLACSHPAPECFCTSVDLSPASTKGSDIFLTPITVDKFDDFDGGPAYIAEVLTKRGQALLKNVKVESIKPKRKDQVTLLSDLRTSQEKKFLKKMMSRRELTLAPEKLKDDFDNPVWEEIGRTCLGCGVCAFVCPTCTCYDLVDEREGECWSRCKNWDSCGFGYFTLHASGHNPRPTQMERYRQRVMHKFSYYVEQTGITMCVGCGRCTKFCPVQKDIYEERSRWQ